MGDFFRRSRSLEQSTNACNYFEIKSRNFILTLIIGGVSMGPWKCDFGSSVWNFTNHDSALFLVAVLVFLQRDY